MSKIKEIYAREIKDSRNNPTIEVELKTEKSSFTASCPSGVSTGKNEALELRDADGRGISKAIENVNKILAPKLKNKDPVSQKELDDIMIELDGTYNKSKLGANAILPVSMVICRAGASAEKLPLYLYISKLTGSSLNIPFPSFNILEGGAHAKNDLDIQEFMIVPEKKSFSENLVLVNKIFQNLQEIITKNYPARIATQNVAGGGKEIEMGDEGGFAPKISKTEQALFLLKNAIDNNSDVKIAIDCAASQFYKEGKYILEKKEFSRINLIDFYKDLATRFPIISIEDPFSEDDWQGFEEIIKEMPNITIIGDDLTTTNVKRIKLAHSKNACNGVIIKQNQIGTVTETIDAAKLVKSFGWKTVVSHRSGETMDDFIADLAVGIGADFIKSGSPSQAERMVKYNRLLEIENELSKI